MKLSECRRGEVVYCKKYNAVGHIIDLDNFKVNGKLVIGVKVKFSNGRIDIMEKEELELIKD